MTADFAPYIESTPGMSEDVIIIRYEPISRGAQGAYPDPQLTEQGRTSAIAISLPHRPRYKYKEEMRSEAGVEVQDVREFYFSYGSVNVTTFNRGGGSTRPRSAILWNNQLYDVSAIQEFKNQGYMLALGTLRNQESPDI